MVTNNNNGEEYIIYNNGKHLMIGKKYSNRKYLTGKDLLIIVEKYNNRKKYNNCYNFR
jgi:hypothetical protein